jgi:hypothetical protein
MIYPARSGIQAATIVISPQLRVSSAKIGVLNTHHFTLGSDVTPEGWPTAGSYHSPA